MATPKPKKTKVNKLSKSKILGGILPRIRKINPDSLFQKHLEDQANREGSRRF